jgi:methylmalonyl-CoA mutase
MEKLFSEFSPANAEDWKARLERDLKGITFNNLEVLDRNDIKIHPFYTIEDRSDEVTAVFQNPDWEICASIIVEDAKTANSKSLQELQGGASGLCFIINKEVDIADLLNGIELKFIYTHFSVTNNEQSFIPAFKKYLGAANITLDELNCRISFDPIAVYLADGEWQQEEAKQRFLNFIAQSNCSNISIDTTLFQNTGANSSYQLACALAQVNEYLYWLDEANRIKNIKNVEVSLATGTDFFEEIAKIRAFRTLLPLVFKQYDINPNVQLHIETSGVYRAPFDAYNNLLRDSIAGMAAVLGGCNSLLIRAFDENINTSNNFSSRMSRNQQLLFKEESYLHKIADVASGSYYLETLTTQIATKSWTYFQEIEKAGGLIAYFEKGIIQSEIATQATKWIQEYKDGKRILIGVNKYPNAADQPIANANKKIVGKGLQPVLLSDEII